MIMRRRKADGKLFGQGVRGALEALEDLPHDGRAFSVGVRDFKRPAGIPGSEPGGLSDGALSEIEKEIPVRAVHEEDQVGPFGEKRTCGSGAVAGEVETEGPCFPHIVLRGRKVLLVGEATGGDLESLGGKPSF